MEGAPTNEVFESKTDRMTEYEESSQLLKEQADRLEVEYMALGSKRRDLTSSPDFSDQILDPNSEYNRVSAEENRVMEAMEQTLLARMENTRRRNREIAEGNF